MKTPSYHSTTLFPVPPLTDKTMDPLFILVQDELTTPLPVISVGVVIVTDPSELHP